YVYRTTVRKTRKGYRSNNIRRNGSILEAGKRKGVITLRLDKFLKVSRLIKRRTLAKEVDDQGRITINGNKAKASYVVEVGDKLTIHIGQKNITIHIIILKTSVK